MTQRAQREIIKQDVFTCSKLSGLFVWFFFAGLVVKIWKYD